MSLLTTIRRGAVACLAVVLVALTLAAQTVSVPMYDVVIRNGHVLDGAGNPAIRADVAIKGGRFVRIGIVTGRGRQEIDATGKYVSPGWIDMMDLRDGLWADVVVLDHDKIQDRSTYEEPSLYPDGIDWVLVNGEVAIDHGRHTGARTGKVIYGPGRRIAQGEANSLLGRR
jgi:N-acyl-D-aspartate/D-glutamate deacylase